MPWKLHMMSRANFDCLCDIGLPHPPERSVPSRKR